MKVQLMLFAGTIAGLTLAATPVLSQERPDTPGMQRPPTTTPGQSTTGSAGFKQAMRMLEGTWQVSVKTFGAGGAEAGAKQMQGTSTRSWILNNNILLEEVQSSGSGSNFQVRDAGNPQTRPGASMGQPFEGHGMFGFDSQTNEFQHIWADSTDSKLCYSSGRYDERTRTFTFNKESGGPMALPPRTTPPATTPPSTTPPSTTPPPRPPSTPPGSNPNDHFSQATPPSQPPTSPPRPSTPPSTPPSTTTPRPGGMANADINIDRVVIRIQDDTHHTVEYYSGGQNKVMEITYTKGGAGATTR